MADTDSVPGVVLEAVYDAAADALVGAALTLPERWGVCHGPPAVDLTEGCDDDILAVWADRIEPRPTGERAAGAAGGPQRVGYHMVVVARLQLWRCFPGLGEGGALPPVEDVNRASLRLLRGAWAIHAELSTRRRDSTLIPDLARTPSDRSSVGVGAMTPIPVSGYAAGWQCSVEASVPVKLEDTP